MWLQRVPYSACARMCLETRFQILKYRYDPEGSLTTVLSCLGLPVSPKILKP